MSVQEMEITERFEGFDERPPFQPPTANEDIKLSRFLFTAANLITPDIARDRPHMKSGGLNVFNPCLNQTKDFIRRGRLTPLLMSQHVPIPVEDAPPGDSSYFNVPLEGESLRSASSFYEQGGMMSRLAYPGQQIMHILEGSPNGLGAGGGHRLGVVEVPTLKGHDYKLENIGGGVLTDKELWKIQKAIFPNYPDLPFKLQPFTDLVKIAIDANTGDIRSIAEEMYPSCVQFEGWAVRHVEKVHQDMGQAAVKGYASPYEQIDIVILDQLGMRREDEHFKRSAQQAAQQQLDPASLIALVREAGAQDREMFMAGMSQLIQEWKSDSKPPVVDENTMKAEPPAVDKEEMARMYLRDLRDHGVEKTREDAARGRYGDLHHETRKRLEREFEASQVNSQPSE